jgi:hypothetical protein
MGRIDIYIHPAPRRVRDAAITRKADGFYWTCPKTGRQYGPFPTEARAKEDSQSPSSGHSHDNLIAGNHRPERVHAKDTPIVADKKPGILDGILK